MLKQSLNLWALRLSLLSFQQDITTASEKEKCSQIYKKDSYFYSKEPAIKYTLCFTDNISGRTQGLPLDLWFTSGLSEVLTS